MSVEAIAWAAKQKAGSPGAKLVLIALANYANEDGECWPSQATLAQWTEQGERTIRRHLIDLEQLGLITRKARTSSGNFTSDLILLNVSRRPILPAAILTDGQKRQLPAANLATYPSIEPKERDVSRTADAKQKAKPQKTSLREQSSRLNPDWSPGEELKAWVRKRRQDLDLQETVDSFRDYWVAKPGAAGQKLDWDATFRNWVRTQREATGKPGGSRKDGGMPDFMRGAI